TLAAGGALATAVTAVLRDISARSEGLSLVCYRVSGETLLPIAHAGVAVDPGTAALSLGSTAEEAFGSRRPVVLEPVPEDVERRLQTEERQRQRLELEAKNVEIQKADQLKSEFLANMSHELRTPLNAIIGFSELLLEEGRQALSPEHVKFVEDVLASGRHLLVLINDILDLAKIESGRIELHLEPVTAEVAIQDA